MLLFDRNFVMVHDKKWVFLLMIHEVMSTSEASLSETTKSSIHNAATRLKRNVHIPLEKHSTKESKLSE